MPPSFGTLGDTPGVGDLFVGVEVAPPTLDVEPVKAALPVPLMLRLESSGHLLHPGETLDLTITAWRATEETIAGLPLILDLPDELAPARANLPIQWTLPELGRAEIFSRTIPIKVVGGAFPFESAVVDVTLRTEATTAFTAYTQSLQIGIESRGQEPPAAPVASAKLRDKGLVLRGRYGDVTLLIGAGSAITETEFTYTDGYRWQETMDNKVNTNERFSSPVDGEASSAVDDSFIMEPLTTTLVMTASAHVSTTAEQEQVYLPLVTGGNDTPSVQTVTDATARAEHMLDDELLVDDGVAFVRRWQLDAHYQGQKRETFDKRIQLVIDTQWIIDQGIDPERLTLYTRADSSQPWETVPTVHYDERQRAFIAHTGHFSEYGLGLDQGVVGESLPDISAFTSDLQISAATVNYPLAVPTGPGGMAPALGLNYSSAIVDNFRLSNDENEGSDRYRVQAGIAGLGWNLSALNHIAYIDDGTDTNDPADDRYSLVLNGTSNIFEKGQELTESFAQIAHWLTKGTLGKFAVQETGEWTITTVDGTKHYFGGEAIQGAALSTTSNQGVMIHNCGQYTQHHVVNKWYLRKSVDLNGNAVEYHYHSPTRQLYDCGRAWYHRAILPTLIQWGGNETVNSPHTMQVRFIYEGRDDWQIWGTDEDYAQSMYSDVRLKQIHVEVAINGGWHQLRQYQLNCEDTQPPAGLQHSWLQEIQHYGVKEDGTRTDAPLNTYRFDYMLGAIHSEVYLLHADNGQGGRVTYSYGAPATWACYIDQTTECNQKAYRRQVLTKTVYDGTSRAPDGRSACNTTQIRYDYEEGLYRKYKNDPIEFLGYAKVRSFTYARNTTDDEVQVTEQKFYRDNATANQVNPDDGYTIEELRQIAGNPDPRLGRLKYSRTLEPNLNNCRKDPTTAQPINLVILQDHEGKELLLCGVAEQSNYSSAHTRNAAGAWVATTNYNDRPRWVRQDYTLAWLDGILSYQAFTYDEAKQGGHQFGNLKNLRTYNRVGTQWEFEGEIRLAHDALGNLLAVYRENQPGGGTSTQLAQMRYDAAGRKLAMDDADLGQWTYGYDRQGRLTEQTDARGCITYLDYDELGRLTQKRLRKATNYACVTGNDGEEETTYFYDQGHGLLHDQQINRSRGQLTTVSRNGYTKQLYYNAQGLLHQEIVTIAGLPSQSTRYGYDDHLRPTTTTYPDGEVVSTAYNSMGLPAKLESSQLGDFVDGTINVFAVPDAVNYDEAGRLTQMRFPAIGSGEDLWQTRTYHPWSSSSGNSNGRLWEIRMGTGDNLTQSSNDDKLRLGYAYDSFGNISASSERFNLGSWPQFRHCYDGQNRLTKSYAQYATAPTTMPACSTVSNGERYSFDAAGNFHSFAATANLYDYETEKDNVNPHAVKWVNIGQGSTTNHTVKIRARGSQSATGWPTMELWVNGVKRQTWTVSNTPWGDYTTSVPLTGRDQIDIVFPNDSNDGGLDRNLYVDWIQVDGVTYPQAAAIVDIGWNDAAFDGDKVRPGTNSTGVVPCALSWAQVAAPWAMTPMAT